MNIEVSLKDVVEDIEKGNFLIPKFQRDFVWKTPDIESLGDSIVRGYPISSMLTMPANGNLRLPTDPLRTAGAISATKDSGGQASYVLDGQQRITSLAKLFLGYDDKKEYYFDMLSILDDRFPDDAIRNMPPIHARLDHRSGYSSITSDLCRSFKRSGDEINSKQDSRFIHGRLIVQNRYASAVSKFLRVFESMGEDGNTIIDKYNDHLNAIFGAMCGYGISFTKINADADLGLVIRVFEKVNTSGKKLTLFDLVNAKSFESNDRSHQKGLAHFMSESLRDIIRERRFQQSAVEMFFNGKQTGDGVANSDLAPFIRCAAMAEYLSKDLVPGISNNEMLEKDADFWFDAWQRHSGTLLKFASKLFDEGILGLMNSAFKEYTTAIVMANPKLLNESIFIKEVKKRSLDLTLSRQPFNKANLDVVMDLHRLGKHLIGVHGFEKYRYIFTPYTQLTSDKFLDRMATWEVGRAEFRAVMYILYSEKAGGKFTIDLAGNAIKESTIDSMDQHHIYPKARTKQEDDVIFNSIANIVMLSRSCNQQEIKDGHPSEYLPEIRRIHGDHADQIFSQNLISDDMLKDGSTSARQALQERLRLIAEIVSEYLLAGGQPQQSLSRAHHT